MKERADKVLLERDLVLDIKEAQSLIMQGLVYLDNVKVEKSGDKIDVNSEIIIKKGKHNFVSRGGLKLEKAVKTFSINLDNKIAMDVGASTGGFTDCMLRQGAKKVYAVDVGYGQLAWQLRTNPKVVVMERTNIRNIKKEDICDLLDFISIDVSFISLKLVLPAIKDLLKNNGIIVALIKPQFEAKKDKVPKGGIIEDKLVHEEVIINIIEFVESIQLKTLDLSYSPVTGANGNIEFLIKISKEGESLKNPKVKTLEVVNNAHNNLK